MAPQVAKMKEKVIVGMDRGFHFKPHEIEDELKKGGAKNIDDVWIFPRVNIHTQSHGYCSDSFDRRRK